ncbi:MAG: sigma-54 dependent transcriptional regulator [Pelovirga sp.]
MVGKYRNLLIIDDEASMRHMLRLVLEEQGYRITEAANGVEALARLRKEKFDLILSDIRMPDMDGLTFLKHSEVTALEATIIMMSAYGSIDTALECIKSGAYDYISKPFKPDEVILTLRKAEERLYLQHENVSLKQALSRYHTGFSIADIIHDSPQMKLLLDQVSKVAATDSPVLIKGETGTGKELIARALHSESGRTGEFLAINCSALTSGLLESELFGHVKGAFTGADREKQGLFAIAANGTLLLDEIADLPLELQPKLLRVLQEGEVRKVGGTRTEKVSARVVAAAGRDLWEAVQTGNFRSDLYYRLAVVDLHIPPLRERCADIPVLARYFLQRICAREHRPAPLLADSSIGQLCRHNWPGNIRELENYLEKALIFNVTDELDLPPLGPAARPRDASPAEDLSLKIASRQLEEEYIRQALERTGGNRTQAAQLLEISLRALMYKIKDYDID